MIWVRRFVPLVVIAGIWFAYRVYTSSQSEREERLRQPYALITAQVWVASAKFRNDPERFLRFRDSLLRAHSLSTESLRGVVDSYRDEPERLDLFSAMVKKYVDSLIAIEDSLLKEQKLPRMDSLSGDATGP